MNIITRSKYTETQNELVTENTLTNHEADQEDDSSVSMGVNSFPQIFEFLKNMISHNSNSKTVYYAMKWIEHLLDYFPKELM